MSPLSFLKKPQAPAVVGDAGKEAAFPTGGVKPELPRPKTGVEAIVQQAPQVLPQLEQVTKQREAEARQTIDMLEAARAEKGNFCVTLGTGPDRAVVLVAPATREWKLEYDDSGRHYQHDETYTDFVLISPSGPRTLSFCTEVRAGTAAHATEGKKKMYLFNQALSKAVRGNGVVAEGRYRDYQPQSSSGNPEMYLDIPRANKPPNSSYNEEYDFHHGGEYRPGKFEGQYGIQPITDEAVVEQAVRASLEQTQSPIRAQIDQVRGQIGALQGARKGLS